MRLVINRQEQGEKGVSVELDGVTRRASGYTVLAYSASVDNESEVAYVRAVMENLPTLAKSPVFGQAAGPKMGKVLGPYISLGVWYPPARRPGVKHTS